MQYISVIIMPSCWIVPFNSMKWTYQWPRITGGAFSLSTISVYIEHKDPSQLVCNKRRHLLWFHSIEVGARNVSKCSSTISQGMLSVELSFLCEMLCWVCAWLPLCKDMISLGILFIPEN
jgi:hypothetical protein